MDAKFYFSLFLRRLHYFLLMLILGSAAGFTLAKILPPVYVATATLLVEFPQIPGELAASTVETAATEQLQIIQQRILTRASLLEMANRLKVYADVGPAQRLEADQIVADMRRRIGIDTTGGGSRGSEATIVTVSFHAPTAALSAAVANEIVTMILRENVSIRTGDAAQTLEFFVQEVSRLDQELSKRGAAILAFKEANLEALPDSLDFRRSQQAGLQERLQQVERDVATLRGRREQLVSLYGAVGELPVPASQQTPEQLQLKSLKDQMSSMLAVMSPQNPRIRVIEAQIAALEATVAGQTATSAAAAAQTGDTTKPPSNYDIQLADMDFQITSLVSQKAQIEASMEALRASIEATPSNAIKLDTMERDFANVRAQYDEAVVKRARAETGDTLETLSKGQRITTIEDAIAPQRPSSPNRPLVAAAGVAGGLALGLGLILLLEVTNSAIRRPADLTSKLGIAPFGTLPNIRTGREVARRRMIIAAAFCVVLIGVPGALWYVHTEITPLDLLLDGVIDKLGLAGPLGRMLG